MLDSKKIELLKTLGQETRFNIVKNLLDKELCACKIPSLINKTQSNTSMHLLKLVELNILKSRRDGKKIMYSIKNKNVYKIFNALK
jgi:ArsR family transcriptional regulator, lead/cadmium/zinc/bismuth-responsive transcriptional repressor